MYNYNHDVSYKHLEDNASNTAYRKAFLTVNNTTDWSTDAIGSIQDDIYEKFQNNEKFINILTKAKKTYQKTIPIDMDNKMVLVLLFEYNSFECFHKCLKDLFNNKDISNENFTEMLNLLS
tara:strand:- start:9342 stop:9704 length:363 start_codon:yes stop_codon:yes gene_type:complete